MQLTCHNVVNLLQLKEVFGAGTACVVSPVDGLVYKGERIDIPTMKDGAPVTMRCYNELTDIQVRVPAQDARLCGSQYNVHHTCTIFAPEYMSCTSA